MSIILNSLMNLQLEQPVQAYVLYEGLRKKSYVRLFFVKHLQETECRFLLHCLFSPFQVFPTVQLCSSIFCVKEMEGVIVTFIDGREEERHFSRGT